MTGQEQTMTNHEDRKTGGCENVISFADFVAHMAKRRNMMPQESMAAEQGRSRVIYIGDLR